MTPQTDTETPEQIAQRIRATFDNQGLMQHLGAVISHVQAGEVHVRMPYKPELTQHHGFFHAGSTSAIADTAGGFAGYTMFPADSTVLTVEFKINLVAPAQGDYLEAVGKVIRSGRTLTICQLEVFGVTQQQRILVALGQQTLICVPKRSGDI